MMLLEWFAGQAICGLLSAEAPDYQTTGADRPQKLAKEACDIAEAVLAELRRREGATP